MFWGDDFSHLRERGSPWKPKVASWNLKILTRKRAKQFTGLGHPAQLLEIRLVFDAVGFIGLIDAVAYDFQAQNEGV